MSSEKEGVGRDKYGKNYLTFYLYQMHEAAMAALDDKLASNESRLITSPWTIKSTHFELALTKISPSVSERVSSLYFLFYFNIK